MEEWKEYELGELITLNSGGTPDKSNKSYWGGDIPWISAKFMYDDYLYSSELKISQEGLDNGSRLAPKGSIDRKSTRLNSSHTLASRMPSSA